MTTLHAPQVLTSPLSLHCPRGEHFGDFYKTNPPGLKFRNINLIEAFADPTRDIRHPYAHHALAHLVPATGCINAAAPGANA